MKASAPHRWFESGWLTGYLIAFLTGNALQLQQPDLWPIGIYQAILLGALLIGAVLIGLRLQSERRRISLFPERKSLQGRFARQILSCAAIILFAFASVGWRAHWQMQSKLPEHLAGRDWQITGVVADLTQPVAGGVRFAMRVDAAQLLPTGSRVAASGSSAREPNPAERIKPENRTQPRSVHVSWYADRASGQLSPAHTIQPGQRWTMTVRLKPVHGNVNPHGFDHELWMWSLGVQATGYVRTGHQGGAPILLSDDVWRAPVARWRQWTRTRIEQTLADAHQHPHRGVVSALVLGDQRAIEDAAWEVFRRTGVAHLMSISGLHITLFAWLSSLVMTWGWRRSARACLWVPAQTVGAWLGVAWALVYALFCGFGVPAQRTVLMLICAVGLKFAAKRWPWYWVALACACAVVVMDPWALLSAGFWLSFVAVCVLFVAQPPDSTGPEAATLRPPAVQASLAGRAYLSLGRRAWQYVRHMLQEQWRVALALTPLTLLLFHQVSLSASLANLIAVPVVTLLVTPLALLGMIWPTLWVFASGLLDALMLVLTALSKVPYAWLTLPAAPAMVGVVAVWGGVCLVLPLSWFWRFTGIALMLPVFLWQPPKLSQGQFELWALDVGQGSSVLIQTAHHAMLYDAGPSYGRMAGRGAGESNTDPSANAGQRVIVPSLWAMGVRLDMVVLSHGDQDHIGGAAAVLAAHPQARVLTSIPPDHPLLAARLAVRRCVAGPRQKQQWQWDGVHFEVLHPTSDDYPTQVPFTDANNEHSCVLRIHNGQRSVLLTGDIGVMQEQRLLQQWHGQPQRLQSDVLVVAHHGSNGSSSDAFLAAVKPQWALIQAGYLNAFAHPSPQVMKRLQAHDIKAVQTAQCGAVHWRSDKPLDVQCERQLRRRYWYHALESSAVEVHD